MSACSYMLFCVVIRYNSIVYHVLGYSLSLNVTLFTILLPHNIFLSCIKAANEIMYIHACLQFMVELLRTCAQIHVHHANDCVHLSTLR